MEIAIPLLCCLIGLGIYLIVKSNAEAKEIGRIMFWTGLLVFLFKVGGATIGFLK